ncbi:porin family protein [Aquimarina mytili]|uniref:PorT family protein n=1 Tax=Aquimarina mytili TaxID=874423 RepID=A0A936ZW43_9FLAO|nr:porin family protein [Aquimarina mytili]MBL0682096.1 PorT family protein [Aquimarina mytili]
MKTNKFILGLLFTLVALSTQAQEKNIQFGLKAGANYAQYFPDIETRDITLLEYKKKFGFYIGGFAKINLSEKFKLQPELLFAIQGSKTLNEGIEIFIPQNQVLIVGDFRTNISETTLLAPIVLQYYATGNFYLEAGPQLGFIIDTKEKVKEDPFNQINNQTFDLDYDTFDVGLTAGAGYKLTEHFGVNARYFFSLTERNSVIKSSIFNLGIEYQL